MSKQKTLAMQLADDWHLGPRVALGQPRSPASLESMGWPCASSMPHASRHQASPRPLLGRCSDALQPTHSWPQLLSVSPAFKIEAHRKTAETVECKHCTSAVPLKRQSGRYARCTHHEPCWRCQAARRRRRRQSARTSRTGHGALARWARCRAGRWRSAPSASRCCACPGVQNTMQMSHKGTDLAWLSTVGHCPAR